MRGPTRLAGLVLALAAMAPAGASDTVIVYDASNSMWGRIEGKPKVTIAREVMAGIIGDWDADTPLGLVAYGHRREGDCSDIETVVPVGPVDKAKLIERINAISPKGKTPLTAAVRHAAGELKYRDAPATVVLISDGIETCNADPCAAASELAEAGINFTAHVIGFDVGEADQAQLQCIADNTGGRFFAARDAAGLKKALGEATKMAAEPIPEAEVTLTAPASAVAGSNVEVSWSGEKIQPRDYVTIVPADAEPDAYGEYKRVADLDSATLVAPGEPGTYEARYLSSATGQAVARAPVELTEPRVTVSAPETVPGGAGFDVSWENRVHPRDYVTIVPAEAPADEYADYIRVGDNGSGRLTAPAEPGAYEVRYLLNSSGRAVASAPVEVVEESVSVTAPESVTFGTEFRVGWDNVIHPRDYVTVVPADAPADEYRDYIRVGDRREGTLQAPSEPGAYEVRYLLQESGRAVASTPVDVVSAETRVSAPESVTGGTYFTVKWTNSIHHRDYVTVVPADASADQYGEYERVGDRQQASLQAPAEPGDYEVRYLLQKSGEAIARAPIRVTEASTSVSAPESVTGGSDFSVKWTSVIHDRDYVTIVSADAPADAYGEYQRVGDRRQATLPAPAQPGNYEVRYLLQKSGRAIATAPVKVAEPRTDVSAPESVTGGTDFTVEWTNVIHPRDYVTIVPADAPPDRYGEYERVGDRTRAKLPAPGEAGRYEVRYLLRVGGKAIARAPVTVEAPEVSVSGPRQATAGAELTVSWDDVVHPRDFITVVPADAPPDRHGEYIRVGDRRQGRLLAPAGPGSYELRYILRVNGEAIAASPIELEAPQVTLSAPSSVKAESQFTVSWENAVHPRDSVTVVPADAPPDRYGEYIRVGDRGEGRLPAPAEPGAYEVRYILHAGGKAIRRQALEVTE